MTPGASTLLVSDFHAGHGSRHRTRKLRAIDAMMSQARQTGVTEIILAGDIADERPDREEVLAECRALTNAIDGHVTLFLRGNHDAHHYFAKEEMEELLRCDVHEGAWHVSPHTGIVITHGHHFRTPSFRRALRHATRAEDLATFCETAESERHVHTMTKRFSAMGRVGSSLDRMGFPVTGLWEDLQRISQRSRSSIAVALRGKKTHRPWRAVIADAIDLRSSRRAARLAMTTRCWGSVSGHTHVPGLYKHHIKDSVSGERIPFLVGNSGSFVSRYAPTCIEVRYPRMTLWQYDESANRMRILQEIELTPEEIAQQRQLLEM